MVDSNLLNVLFQIYSVLANLLTILFVGYYFLHLRVKEKEIDKVENNINTNYHEVVEDALSRHRKILEDATTESAQIMAAATKQADQIITGTQYISQTSKTTIDQAMQKLLIDVQSISTGSKLSLDQALQKLTVDLQKEAFDTARDFVNKYSASLSQGSAATITDFQNITKEMGLDLQKQMKQFRESLLPAMQKELDEYKLAQLKEAQELIRKIIQRASEEILKKSLSLDDHENLMIESLEKAKMEGVFDQQ